VIIWGITNESGRETVCISTCYLFYWKEGQVCRGQLRWNSQESIWWKSKAFDSRLLFTAANFSHTYQVLLIQVLDFFPTVERESHKDLQYSIEMRRKRLTGRPDNFFSPTKSPMKSYFAFIMSRHPNAVAVGVNSW